MANMSYCKFENTFADLKNCSRSLTDPDLSSLEAKYRDKLVDLCRDIVDEYDAVFGEEGGEEDND